MKTKLFYFIMVCLIFQTELHCQWTVVPAGGNINSYLTQYNDVALTPNTIYGSSSTIYVNEGQSLYIPASTTIKYSGQGFSPAISIESSGNIFGGGIIEDVTRDWNNNRIGIRVWGSNSKVDVGEIRDFTYGIYCHSRDSNHGVAYNNISVRLIKNCKFGVKLYAINEGWVNNNYFTLQRIQLTLDSAHYAEIPGTFGIHIDSDTEHAPNANKFSGSIEDVDKGLYLTGYYNRFEGIRLELGSKPYTSRIQIENTSYGTPPFNNYMFGEYGYWKWDNDSNVCGSAKSRDALLAYGTDDIAFPKCNIISDRQDALVASFGRESGENLNRFMISENNNTFRLNTGGNHCFPHIGIGGADRAVADIFIKDNGKIGIGYELPNYKVEWSNGTHRGFLDHTTSGAAIGSSTGTFSIYTNGLQRIDVTTDGNVRVGTSILPFSNNTGQIGTSTTYWNKMYSETFFWIYPIQFFKSAVMLDEKISNLYSLDAIVTSESKQNSKKSYTESKQKYGFSKEELESLFPELIISGDSSYAVDMISFIPLLLEAFKYQKSTIDSMKLILYKLSENLSSSKVYPLSQAQLFQNYPNPYSQTTDIEYYIPNNFKNAAISIINEAGVQIKYIKINISGTGRLTLYKNEYMNGNYLYSLIIDGKLIDTKQMIVN